MTSKTISKKHTTSNSFECPLISPFTAREIKKLEKISDMTNMEIVSAEFVAAPDNGDVMQLQRIILVNPKLRLPEVGTPPALSYVF